MSEAMPLPVTALLPLVILPLGNVMPLKKASASFMADLIILFLGGFILSLAIQKWRVRERIGLGMMRYVAWSVPSLIAGFMAVIAFLGMWMSNTAAAMVMMPMALSVAALITKDGTPNPSVKKAFVLTVAYAPCLGGLATFIGPPPNAVFEGFVSKTYGVKLSLAQWMAFGVPIAAFLLICCWLLLYFTLLRGTPKVAGLPAMMRNEYAKLGAFTKGEITTTVIFIGCVQAWTLGDFWSGLIGGRHRRCGDRDRRGVVALPDAAGPALGTHGDDMEGHREVALGHPDFPRRQSQPVDGADRDRRDSMARSGTPGDAQRAGLDCGRRGRRAHDGGLRDDEQFGDDDGVPADSRRPRGRNGNSPLPDHDLGDAGGELRVYDAGCLGAQRDRFRHRGAEGLGHDQDRAVPEPYLRGGDSARGVLLYTGNHGLRSAGGAGVGYAEGPVRVGRSASVVSLDVVNANAGGRPGLSRR